MTEQITETIKRLEAWALRPYVNNPYYKNYSELKQEIHSKVMELKLLLGKTKNN